MVQSHVSISRFNHMFQSHVSIPFFFLLFHHSSLKRVILPIIIIPKLFRTRVIPDTKLHRFHIITLLPQILLELENIVGAVQIRSSPPRHRVNRTSPVVHGIVDFHAFREIDVSTENRPSKLEVFRVVVGSVRDCGPFQGDVVLWETLHEECCVDGWLREARIELSECGMGQFWVGGVERVGIVHFQSLWCIYRVRTISRLVHLFTIFTVFQRCNQLDQTLKIPLTPGIIFIILSTTLINRTFSKKLFLFVVRRTQIAVRRVVSAAERAEICRPVVV